jgi:hypothetical protein
MNGFLCWLLGHDPILREDMKVAVVPRIEDHGTIVLHFVGRTLYIGETTCKRCGRLTTLR